ncbi:hypothetical protein CYLTODRAFT_202556 [Cylindrobasidium torrendii FP15055 ss-10]|uniref:BTB domain-containing protein n=1 Tax=Cylindrobasidium torrendii FP15055 ss-10 TaxID=1314674 RepID=A0A0D7BHS5_9AGAR|nr:hypothetical protein CYLTODRAFT_202556 [Cylindrobasidium torrendii FP15055 ss-10]
MDLVRASPFFDNLLADGIIEEVYEGLPLCPVLEDSGTMHFILRLCSPGHITILDLLDASAKHALSPALDKYLMDQPRQRVEDILRGSHEYVQATDNALRVYALARAFGLDVVAQVAARQSLSAPLEEWEPSPLVISVMSAADLHTLLQYRMRCSAAAHHAANIVPSPSLTSEGCADNTSTRGIRCVFCTAPKTRSRREGVEFPDAGDCRYLLSIGRSAFHIRTPNSANNEHISLAALDKILHIGDEYKQAPGRRAVCGDLFELLYEATANACSGRVSFRENEARATMKRLVEQMQKDVDTAVVKVPLEVVGRGEGRGQHFS